MITLLLQAGIAQAASVESFTELMRTSWATAPSSYSTTFSPCLDGLVVNFRTAGCKVIAEDPDKLGEGSVGLVCTAPTKLNGWTRNEHVIFSTATHSVQDFPGWDVFCVDPNITMYIPERPLLSPR
jgi:hypothetical protein